jgi:CTP synthase
VLRKNAGRDPQLEKALVFDNSSCAYWDVSYTRKTEKGVWQNCNNTKIYFVTEELFRARKRITAASIGAILKARGLRVNIQKMDPYFNFDAGTLNPAEHGEVFVTADGGETDLDLGHYERFVDLQLTRNSSVMSGQVYAKVFADERDGLFR